MMSLRRFLFIPVFIPLLAAAASAQDAAPTGGSVLDELRALRQLSEQQAKQLQLLSDQVARLTVLVENRAAANGTVPAARPAEFAIPAARPVTTAPMNWALTRPAMFSKRM